jgi:hypothetical protein
VNVELQDQRTVGRQIRGSFDAELRPEQKEAVNQVLHYDNRGTSGALGLQFRRPRSDQSGRRNRAINQL